MGMFKVFFMKKVKRKNKKDVNTIKPKPYTVKQENDIVIGKMLMWIFILLIVSGFNGFLFVHLEFERRKEKVANFVSGNQSEI